MEMTIVSNCTSGCPTQDCESYGACLRNKGARVAYCNSAGGWDYTAQKKHDADLSAYKDARAQGIQPETTQRRDVVAAISQSDKSGTAYQAGA